jgi:hypothetical protein
MPLYFSEVAPQCPISTDSSTGPKQAHLFNSDPRPHRSTIPRVPEGDLRTALLVSNIARSIVTAMVRDTVKNNVKQAKGGGKVSIAPPKFKNKAARWVEQKSQRIKRKYKYFGVDREGKEDENTYVTVERIERMVWYDKAWKSYLVWEYGEKGEGKPV